MSHLRTVRILPGALALLAALAAPAAAQSLSLEAHGGAVFPVGDLSDLQQPGGAFGGGIGLAVHPRVGLRLDVSASFMDGEHLDDRAEVPGINLIHFTAGVETPLFRTPGARHPLTLSGNLGAGVSMLDVEAFVVPQGRPQAGRSFVVQETYPTVNGGLRFAAGVTGALDLVISGQAYRVFVDEEDTAVLALISDRIEAPESVWSLPLTVGVRLRL